MFEFVPILNGLYLTYGEYFGLLFFIGFLLFAFILHLFSKIAFSLAKGKKKVKVDYIKDTIKIRAYNDVLRALGIIFTLLYSVFLCLSFGSLSAFQILPMWIVVILNKIVLTSLFGQILIKLDGKKMKKFTFRRGLKKIKQLKDTRLRNIILLAILGISFLIPYAFDDTCVCLYEQGYQEAFNLDGMGVPAAFNTKLSRMFQVNQACSVVNGPCHVYATVPEETSSEVFITLHTHQSVKTPLIMKYGSKQVKSTVFHFNDLEDRGQRCLHTFYLKDLQANTLYELSVSFGSEQYVFQYRTLRNDYSVVPLKLISGGDVGNSLNARKVWWLVGQQDPDIILVGGDLAYDNNILGCYWTWDLLLDQVDLMNKQVGRIVPIIWAVGNHDYGLNPNNHRHLQLSEHSVKPMFITYFPQHLGKKGGVPNIKERKAYFAQKLGKSVLFTLDSGYQNSYQSQADYVDEYLKKNSNTKLRLAQYHHPIYSSCTLKDYESFNFEEGSLIWVPLFDRHHFTTVYENHQHTLKRTKLMKGNVEDKDGTLYLGDGSWGANVQDCSKNNHKYLEEMSATSAVWISTIVHQLLMEQQLMRLQDKLIMFEFIPILKGLYLTYAEDLALLVGGVALILAIIMYYIGRLFYGCAKRKIKVKVDDNVIKIKTYFDVLRALGLVFTIIAALFLCIFSAALSAFNIAPMFIMVIFNLIVLHWIFLHVLLYQNHKSYSIKRTIKLIRANYVIPILLILFSFAIPLFFDDTCACIYDEYYPQAISIGFGLQINTRITRYFQIEKACNQIDQICHAYATLPEETSSQVFINIHTHESLNTPLILKVNDQYSFKSSVFHFNDLEHKGQRRLHVFHVTNLQPNTTYTLSLQLQDNLFTLNYRTLASSYTETPLKLIQGGDVGNFFSARLMWGQVAHLDPDVVVIGGDLAYDNNIKGCYWTWDLWLDQVDLMNNRVNRLVPIILAVGNHDYGLNPYPKRKLLITEHTLTPVYLSYFPQHLGKDGGVPLIKERKPYFVQKIGEYVLFTLDSGYQYSYELQGQFMDLYLRDQQFKMKFAQYHHPIYSSCKLHNYELINFEEGTLNWVPIFDKYSFTTIYENHQHTLKRTKLLKGNQPHLNGTSYLGDGSWGAGPEHCDWNEHIYIETQEYEHSLWFSTISDNLIIDTAIHPNSTVLDQQIRQF